MAPIAAASETAAMLAKKQRRRDAVQRRRQATKRAVGWRLWTALCIRGLGVPELARRVGVVEAAIEQCLDGRRLLKEIDLRLACRILAVSPDWVETGEGKEIDPNVVVPPLLRQPTLEERIVLSRPRCVLCGTDEGVLARVCPKCRFG